MIRSMTGFGKASGTVLNKKLSVEIRSLNSKQTDIYAKMPWIYKEKEIEIRNMISKVVERGKIDFSLNVDLSAEQQAPQINQSVVKSYYEQLKEVAGELYIDNNDQLLSIIMRLPETLSSEKNELDPEEWKTLQTIIGEALKELNSYRVEEGKALESDISSRVGNILELLKQIEPFEKARIETLKEKINKALNDSGIENVDMNRFEQELIYYIEKLDLNEEKVRLRKNCELFIETVENENSNGKKLGFISQEVGREINTIGSKANDAAIQRLVVKMKDELEKIKEQVLNIL